MIPLDTRRAAERKVVEAKINATPSPARFRTHALPVLMFDPVKARELRIAGFGADWSGDCYLALPLTDRKPPESEKEIVEVQDWSGQTHIYTVKTVQPLLADNCYRLSLRPRSARQSPRGAAPGS